MDWNSFFTWAYERGLPPLRADMTVYEWRRKMEMAAKFLVEWAALQKGTI